MRAPASDSRATARSKLAETVASIPSSITFCGTASRRPASDAGASRAGCSPASTASMTAQHSTDGASGPTESRLGASGSTPSIGTRRAVGL